jgi:probable phosphoglycerate mutase
MKKIITIQHPQSIHHTNGMVGSWTDIDLSELGIKQANNIANKLALELDGKECVIYSSDLLRTKHTAEIIGNKLGVNPILKFELRERNLGKCCGKSVEWLKVNLEKQEVKLMINCLVMQKAEEMYIID